MILGLSKPGLISPEQVKTMSDTTPIIATKITENMKMAASNALAALAREDVPDYVKKAHNRGDDMTFGPEYIIPSPFDKRVLPWVAAAVAKAAIEDGVARKTDLDMDAYMQHLVKMREQM